MIENFNLKCSKVLSISGLGKRRRKLSKCQAADGRFRWAFYVGVVFNTVIRLHWFLFWAGCRRMILEEILPIFSPQMAQIITIPQAACVDLCFQGLLCVFGGSVVHFFFHPIRQCWNDWGFSSGADTSWRVGHEARPQGTPKLGERRADKQLLIILILEETTLPQFWGVTPADFESSGQLCSPPLRIVSQHSWWAAAATAWFYFSSKSAVA